MKRTKSLPPADSQKHCVGCGAEFARPGAFRYRTHAVIRVGKDVEVNVCRNGVCTDITPKESCAAAARERLALCPGCNATHTPVGRLCFECHDFIAVGKQQPTDTKPYQFRPGDLFAYLDSELHGKAALALAKMLGGPVQKVNRNCETIPEKCVTSHCYADPIVLLSDDQAAAVKEFVALWQVIFEEQRAKGRQSGHSFILDLAAGKVSLEEFNERDAAVRQATDEAEDDVRRLRLKDVSD